MPLLSGKSQKVISKNISKMSHEPNPRPRNQILAIALTKAGKSKKKTSAWEKVK